MKTAIVWFKTDLRLEDNETFSKAVSQNEVVIPIYCFDENQFTTTKFGFKKTGSFRAQFLLESLEDLDSSLRKLGSGLMILKGKPDVEIAKIVTQFNAQKVYSKKEVAFEEKQTESLVQNALFKLRCELETFSTSTLYNASDLPFSIKDIPDIFTKFRKRTEAEANIRSCYEIPTAILSPKIEKLILPTLTELGLSIFEIDARSVLQFKGGETEAKNRLNHYFFETQLLSKYKETRNGMIGSDYSSKFSVWLAHGCISPRFIYQEVQKYEAEFGANESTYWLIFELLWRDFFRFMFKKYPNKFFLFDGLSKENVVPLLMDDEKFKSWINGKTGDDFVNANMIELNKTGFMSNRGRQNVASYFCHNLQLDWRFGAAYFEEQLIDYDVCSNWGNWAYLAGVGNDPRENRVFNTEKQAKDYDKNSAFRELWLKK